MLDVTEPDTTLLNDPANRESRPLDYAVDAIQWFYWARTQNVPGLEIVDPRFVQALEAVILYFDTGTTAPASDTAVRLRESLAFWRNDFDPSNHPLAQLGRVVKGDPGGNLDLPGPVFLLTFDQVLEGISHEYLADEWDLADGRSAYTFLALAAIVLSEICIAVYWSLQSHGQHLHTELARLFGPANREALVGQLGNLVLAGQVASWQHRVTFIPESDVKTPEWSAGAGSRAVFVECTSYRRTAEEMNDVTLVRKAIATAWTAKKGKFSAATAPGIIATDTSGLYVSRAFNMLAQPDYVDKAAVTLPTGLAREFGVYRLFEDWELLQDESCDRGPLGMMASAVHSAEAAERGIRGIMTYQGQQVVVNVPAKTFMLPKRASLVWRRDPSDDADLGKLLAGLCHPASPSQVAAGRIPPISIFYV